MTNSPHRANVLHCNKKGNIYLKFKPFHSPGAIISAVGILMAHDLFFANEKTHLIKLINIIAEVHESEIDSSQLVTESLIIKL